MTQATASVNSTNITTLDTVPLVQLTGGEGAPGGLIVQDDYIHVTTAMLAAGQVWRLCRIPTRAKVKRVLVAPSTIMDTNATQTLALDFNVAFSDSTQDGTPANLQALIPTSANTGATTTVSAYSSPNILFGTVTLSGNDLQFPPKINGSFQMLDITFNKGGPLYNSLLLSETPLYKLLGFVNGQGASADPGGFFDLLVDVATAAATAGAADFYARVEYCV